MEIELKEYLLQILFTLIVKKISFYSTNQKLLAEISAFINGKTEDAEGWIHIMTNLKTGNERPQYESTLSIAIMSSSS